MNYKLNDLFTEAFGKELKEIPNTLSQFGTPVLHPLTFLAGKYKAYNGTQKPEKTPYSEFTLPYSSIVNISGGGKKMVVTKIPHSVQGSVKEIFGYDDYKIKIHGFLLPDNSQLQGLKTVKQQETELVKWNNVLEGIEVLGIPFEAKGIDRIAIEDIEVKRLRGRPNVVPFVIHAESMETVEFEIEPPQKKYN